MDLFIVIFCIPKIYKVTVISHLLPYFLLCLEILHVRTFLCIKHSHSFTVHFCLSAVAINPCRFFQGELSKKEFYKYGRKEYNFTFFASCSDVETYFMPWLLEKVEGELNRSIVSRTVLDGEL